MKILVADALREAAEIVKKFKKSPELKPPRRRPAIQNVTDKSDYMKEYMHKYRKDDGKDYQKIPDKVKKFRSKQRKRLKKKLMLKSAKDSVIIS